jgi:hypothetical protein
LEGEARVEDQRPTGLESQELTHQDSLRACPHVRLIITRTTGCQFLEVKMEDEQTGVEDEQVRVEDRLVQVEGPEEEGVMRAKAYLIVRR